MTDKQVIYKNIKSNSGMNPYSDKFDIDIISNEIEKIMSSKIDNNNLELVSTLQTLVLLNQQFKSYYDYLSKAITITKFNIDEYLSVLIGFVNGNYTNICTALHKSLKTVYTQLDITEFKIESMDKSIGNVNAIASIEGQLDDLNNVLSHFRFFLNNFENKTFRNSNLTDDKILKESNIVANVILNTSVYQVIKSAFELTIWNNGTMKFDIKKNACFLQLNEFELAVHKTGVIRMGRLIMQNRFILDKSDNLKSIFSGEIQKNKENQKRIKKIEFIKGVIKYKLAKGYEKEYINEYIGSFAEITTFYSFIIHERLPSYKNLTVIDCIKLLSHLKLFFQKVSHQLESHLGKKELIKFLDVPSKIHKLELANYLTQKYNGQRKKVNNFLALITQQLGSRISFWRNPLLKSENYFYIPFISITSPNISYLIDEILESGGFNLDIRGKYFEKFIARDIAKDLNYKGFFHNIYDSIKVKKSKSFEEIDLIIELDKVIILAEIKCLKYSLTGRDYSSAFKSLTKAVTQVKRKLNFIKIHNGQLDNLQLDIDKKPIHLVVINQYPLFTGLVVEGVPILDYSVLESYFKSGEFNQSKITKDKIETIKSTKYYTDEITFNDNLNDYLISPIPIRVLMDNINYSWNKITPEDYSPSIFTLDAFVAENYDQDNFGIDKSST